MNGNILYIKRPLFSSSKRIAERICQNTTLIQSAESTAKCTVLENSNMIVAIRRHMIDVILLTPFDMKEKRSLYASMVSYI